MRPRKLTRVAVLFALSGCAVPAEMDHSSAADPPVETPDAKTGAAQDAGAWGSPNASAGSAGAAGAAGAAGVAGAGGDGGDGGDGDPSLDAGSDAGANDDGGNGALCPTTTEYALKYFDALKAGAQQTPCSASSCAAGQCCYKQKLCVEE